MAPEQEGRRGREALVENGGPRVGPEGTADKSCLNRTGKGSWLHYLHTLAFRCFKHVREDGKEGGGESGLVRRQQTKVVSFHVLAACFALCSPCAGDRGFSSWGWQMECQRSAPRVRGGASSPPISQLHGFFIKALKAMQHIAVP